MQATGNGAVETGFLDKLRLIREAGDRRSREALQERSDRALERSLQTMKAFEFRGAAEAVIERHAAELVAMAPRFEPVRGCYDARYALGWRAFEQLGDEGGRTFKAYSRITFLLGVDGERGVLSVHCAKTVRNRDRESSALEIAMTPEGLEQLSAFVEREVLGFADAYFGGTQGARSA